MESIDVAPTSSPTLDTEQQAENAYEQMCISLYAYRYGAIGFIDLLKKFEESLGIASPQTKPQVTSE